ncbi:thioredoxin family protein [Epilithonimonas hungarica]|uniref:Thioredoxin-like domain-containing protein n=1 Tax=Epilithonimonas hungarica TaxID=454006 RepID=A0A1G7VD04_9FLAO|nr:thioredoxin fold domain-containing protein [Epilithonimonas hungarica]MDP9957766.1 thioredoxin-related protein [Epilithonimonas hungarica]SDG57438.1 Thioredoxin-like domain-containing protein [Epilithonimonas hungarica]
MKKLILIFLLTTGFFGMAQVRWITLSQALEAQKKEPRKILIDFYADWCAPCREMEKYTFNHPEIAKIINQYYYAVKFESDGNESVTFAGHKFTNPDYKSKKGKNGLHQFSKYMNINIIPTMIFLDENTDPITSLSGALKAKEVEPYFTMIAKNEYKNIKTRKEWESYQRKFKSKIKE